MFLVSQPMMYLTRPATRVSQNSDKKEQHPLGVGLAHTTLSWTTYQWLKKRNNVRQRQGSISFEE